MPDFHLKYNKFNFGCCAGELLALPRPIAGFGGRGREGEGKGRRRGR